MIRNVNVAGRFKYKLYAYPPQQLSWDRKVSQTLQNILGTHFASVQIQILLLQSYFAD